MKTGHLDKVAARAERALELLLPWNTARGEVADPRDRLKDIIRRVGGPHRQGSEIANDIWALTELLETDVPELIQAVRDAQAEARDARAALTARAGDKYQIVIMSDAPIAVRQQETILARDQEGTQS
jgi:hypothetical protein